MKSLEQVIADYVEDYPLYPRFPTQLARKIRTWMNENVESCGHGFEGPSYINDLTYIKCKGRGWIVRGESK